MKTNPRSGNAAFTLIELMAVITIIVILAGLVVGGMSFVNERQAKEKARVQIALLSKALEEYKLDNGSYPPTNDTATGFTPGSSPKSIVAFEPGATGKASTLYGVLYQYGVTNNTRVYVPDLDPKTSKQGWTSIATGTDILDPWGKPYCYRSAFGKPTTSGDVTTVAPNPATQNPDFDLWSMGKDGTSNTATPSDKKNRDDIKNF